MIPETISSLPGRLGRAVTMRLPSPGVRQFVRNGYRLICSSREQLVATRYGFQIRAAARDYASYGIYFFGEYDPRMTDVIRHHLRPGMVAWDLGAERGWFALLMGAIVGPSGRVDAFEAFPATAEKLRQTVAINGFSQVRVHNVAVSDRAGTLSFRPPEHVKQVAGSPAANGGVGHLVQVAAAGDIEVPAITLDEFAAREAIHRLDLVKLDIEGAEPAALRGGRETIERFRPILAVEYNRVSLRELGSSMEELDGLLDQLGYDRLQMTAVLRPIDLEKARGRPDEHAVFNVYCFPRERAAIGQAAPGQAAHGMTAPGQEASIALAAVA